MACFAFNGLPPNPPRVWSRVQGICSTDPTNYSQFIYSPETDTYITIQQQADLFAILNKGNVLQYKKNSSHITKKQRYSQIAKGSWINRNTTWASQTITTTMPNTQSLKRVNYKTIYLDTGAPANLPITCPDPDINIIPNALPINPNPPGPPGPDDLGPFPKLPDKPSNPSIVPGLPIIKPPVIPTPQVVIPDGGDLICSIAENICTGEIISSTSTNNCNPTSASDVPGPIINLCYNSNKYPTYYARSRYIMTNSANKFPEGYKFTPLKLD